MATPKKKVELSSRQIIHEAAKVLDGSKKITAQEAKRLSASLLDLAKNNKAVKASSKKKSTKR